MLTLMNILINILIIFFIVLISFQIILGNYIVEGLQNTKTYQPYDTDNPSNVLILAQKNAGNIEYIKERIDSLQDMNATQQIQDLSGNINLLQEQMNELVIAQQQYASQLTGGTVPNITGATSDDTIDEIDVIDANDTNDLVTL